MIDWIDERCKSWGSSTALIMHGVAGWPSMDTIERARQGLLSMGEGSARQHFPEVRRGYALEIARAMCEPTHMPLQLTATMWAQYVVGGKVPSKLAPLSRYLGHPISLPEYWRNVDRAHYFLAARLTVDTKPLSCTRR